MSLAAGDDWFRQLDAIGMNSPAGAGSQPRRCTTLSLPAVVEDLPEPELLAEFDPLIAGD